MCDPSIGRLSMLRWDSLCCEILVHEKGQIGTVYSSSSDADNDHANAM